MQQQRPLFTVQRPSSLSKGQSRQPLLIATLAVAFFGCTSEMQPPDDVEVAKGGRSGTASGGRSGSPSSGTGGSGGTPGPVVTVKSDAGAAVDVGGSDVGVASADAGDAGSGTRDGSSPGASAYRATPCPFAPPIGRSVTCGLATVPENRAAPTGKQVQVAVAVLLAKTPKPGALPLLYVDGGPGEAGLRTVSREFPDAPRGDFLALAEQRDLVFFDPRGTGSSTPALHCEPVQSDERGTTEKACLARLASAGIDPARYGTIDSADDIDDLRKALGYQQWDVLGASYGTRVVLELLRRHPAGVHAAVVDSVLPPEVDLLAETGPSVYRALDLALDRCAAEPACNRAYPKLEATLTNLLADLRAKPVQVRLADGTRAELDDQRFMGAFVLERLGHPQGVATIPELVFQVRDKNYTRIAPELAEPPPPPATPDSPPPNNGDGVYNTVICAEEAPYTTAAKVAARGMSVPAAFRPYFTEGRLELCADWKISAAPAVANQAVSSDVPVLLLSGSLDPVTPPAWAKAALASLPKGQAIELRGLSHITFGDECVRGLITGFLADPSAAARPACLGMLTTLPFRIER